MVVKVYVSGISGNQEVKKRQQRVLMILDSKNIKYDVIDITEPGKESDKDFMQNNSKSNGGTVSDPKPRSALPPQLFNDAEYCGDYDLFDLANEVDTLEQFLKLEVPPEQPEPAENVKETTLNGDASKTSKENSQEKEVTETDKPAEDEAENDKEKSPVKEGTPSREETDKLATKEATPARDGGEEQAIEESTKETAPEKESSPARQKSVEKEGTPAKEKSPAKEVEEPKVVTEEASIENESVNGTVSSRGESEEKEGAGDAENVQSKKNPSELLIESEQTAAAE